MYQRTDGDQNIIIIETGFESQKICESEIHSTGDGKTVHTKISGAPK